MFAEYMRASLNAAGRAGCIVPSGIATDDTTKLFFQELIRSQSLASLFDFENKGLFPAVHSSYKFSLCTFGSGAWPVAEAAQFVFFAHNVNDLKDEDRRFTLTPADIRLLNPNTRTCPIFRTARDAILTKAVYRRVPVLIREAQGGEPAQNPWGIKFNRMFDMSNDSHLFRLRAQLEDAGYKLNGNVFVKGEERYLPLYEAKMIHHFNHRWATYEAKPKGPETRDVTEAELRNPNFAVMPRYWVAEAEAQKQLNSMGWQRPWLMGWRDITNSTNERTVISAVIPRGGVGDTFLLMSSQHELKHSIIPILNSFVCDYATRQKIGGVHLKFHYFKQLPVLSPEVIQQPAPWQPSLTLAEWLKPRILELTYTAEDMRPFARDLDYDGEPFAWNEDRRARLRAEIDAAFFHLYLPCNADGTWQKHANKTEAEYAELTAAFPAPRDAVDYIMETFAITKRKDMEKYGEYRTKEMILGVYEGLGEGAGRCGCRI